MKTNERATSSITSASGTDEAAIVKYADQPRLTKKTFKALG